MIGQIELRNTIAALLEEKKFPRFSILVGPVGSGKRLLATRIALKLSDIIFPDIGIRVQDVRTVILNSYKVRSTTVYIIPNADLMSVEAKNALLKITEEPPNKAYFIMTLTDINKTLETIKSRANIFYMDRYSPTEITEYAKQYIKNADIYKPLCEINTDIYRQLCETPGDVELLYNSNPVEFYNYVKLVFDNIAEVSGSNAFKIASKVKLQEDVDGYDLRLFWKIFQKLCFDQINPTIITNTHLMVEWIRITSRYLVDLQLRGINKKMLMDMWILDIRKVAIEWM